MNISHISVSRKSVWDQCKLRYKYQYHLKLESLEPEPEHFNYGKIIHKIAEEYVLCKGNRSIGELTKDILDKKIPIDRNEGSDPIYAKPIGKEYKNKLHKHLAELKTKIDFFGFDGFVEYPINYDLNPPNNYFIKGYIDRIINKGDKWIILDYKTSKKSMFLKNKDTIKKDLQLRIYAKAVQREFNVDPSNIYAALLYLDAKSIVGAKFSQQLLDSAENELIQTYEQIVNTSPENVVGSYSNLCNYCDYKSICSYYKIC